MDEGDYGQDYQSRLNAEAIERHRQRDSGYGGHDPCPPAECEWCGEEIPEARRKAVPGCVLCVDCQAEKEFFKERR